MKERKTKSWTILIIDDDASFLEEIQQILSVNGYATLQASTLKTAQHMIRQYRPAIVIMDKKLPDGDGQSLMADIQHYAKGALVFILTGYGTMESTIDGLRNGITDYLLKPVNPNELLNKIETALIKKNIKITNEYLLETAAEEEHKKYKLLLENINDAVLVVDLDQNKGIILDCNESAAALVGCPKKALIGQIQTFLSPIQERKLYDQTHHSHSKHNQTIDFEAEMRTKNGQTILVQARAIVTKLNDKKCLYMTFRNITDLVKADDILESLRTTR